MRQDVITDYSADDPADYLKSPEQLEVESEAKQVAKELCMAVLLAYRRLFDCDDGKRVLEDLSRELKENEDLFSANALYHSYLSGRRSALLYIREQLRKEII